MRNSHFDRNCRGETKMRSRGKLIPISILIFCVLAAAVPMPFLAENEASTGEENGNVEIVIPEDAIYISSSDDLLRLAEACRVNTWSVDKTIVLANDIDMSNVSFCGIPTFAGTFVGQGYTIKGLQMEQEGSVVGLFRYLQETALVDGLNLEGNLTPEGSKSIVGGIVGENAGRIQNCSFTGEIGGYVQIGGIAGTNKIEGVISGCMVYGTVYGSHFVGGITGYNEGYIEESVNYALINTKSVQNSVDLADITMDSVLSTESANTSTDIGGICGYSGGILLGCTNHGDVGYKNMGYDVGGIAGSQQGYLAECENYAVIQGRKDVGGIVGHMQVSITLVYEEDTFMILSDKMKELSDEIEKLNDILNNLNKKMEKQMDLLEEDMEVMQKALTVISEEMHLDEFENGENPDDIEDVKEMLERLEEVDWNRVSDALTQFSDALASATSTLTDMQKLLSKEYKKASAQMDLIMQKMEEITDTLAEFKETLGFSVEDVSKEATEGICFGKVENCVNYGKVSGELNIGGIAGIMAQKSDLDNAQDITSEGEESLYGTYELYSAVSRCKNYANIAGTKQSIGGIVGEMELGAIIEALSIANLDALKADKVGGIAGNSNGYIADSHCRSQIAGDCCVGGIAGEGKEIQGCYAFVSIAAASEKQGAIAGVVSDISQKLQESAIFGNYYFATADKTGGIDGIIYTGAAECVGLEEYLQLEKLPEELRKIRVTFCAEGEETVVRYLLLGESLTESEIPILSVAKEKEYNWRLVREIVVQEDEKEEYISPELLEKILFSQTYEAVFDLKTTVIEGALKTADGHPLILAVGIFSNDTGIELEDKLAEENGVQGVNFFENQKVILQESGVNRLHYRIPEGVKADNIKLYVKDVQGEWTLREYTVDGSYLVFDFTDADVNFALAQDTEKQMQTVMILAAGIGAALLFIVILRKKRFSKTLRTHR